MRSAIDFVSGSGSGSGSGSLCTGSFAGSYDAEALEFLERKGMFPRNDIRRACCVLSPPVPNSFVTLGFYCGRSANR